MLNNDLKALMDDKYNQCINCKKCQRECIMLTEYIESPKQFFNKECPSDELVFSCTLCGKCSHVCPQDIEFDQVFLALKRDRINSSFMTKNKVNYWSINLHQMISFSKLVSSTHKANEKEISIFFPGCSLTGYSNDLIHKIYEYLNQYETVELFLKCCGNPGYSIGDKKFDKRIASLKKEFEILNVREIVTTCPNCISIFEKYLDIQCISLWEKIEDIGVETLDKVSTSQTYYLHDSCATRNNSKVHGSVRRILNYLEVPYEEFNDNRERTICCGSGGMLEMINKDLSDRFKKKRVEESDGMPIISYCQECSVAFEKAGNPSHHLVEIIFNQTINKKKSSLKIWKNRYDFKKTINKKQAVR